jgi:predicted metal-dependent HD superfamily phosphohydrolase
LIPAFFFSLCYVFPLQKITIGYQKTLPLAIRKHYHWLSENITIGYQKKLPLAIRKNYHWLSEKMYVLCCICVLVEELWWLKSCGG